MYKIIHIPTALYISLPCYDSERLIPVPFESIEEATLYLKRYKYYTKEPQGIICYRILNMPESIKLDPDRYLFDIVED